MLFEDLSQLADGFRQRFNTSDRLTIKDMVSLVTPPKFNPNLIEGSDGFDGYPTNDWVAFNVSKVGNLWNGLVTALLNTGGLIGKKQAYPAGTYTFSVFARAESSDTQATIGFVGGVNNQIKIESGKLTTDWQRIEATIRLGSNNTGRFQISPTNGKLEVAGEKVESGSFATDYVSSNQQVVEAPVIKVGGVIKPHLFSLVSSLVEVAA